MDDNKLSKLNKEEFCDFCTQYNADDWLGLSLVHQFVSDDDEASKVNGNLAAHQRCII